MFLKYRFIFPIALMALTVPAAPLQAASALAPGIELQLGRAEGKAFDTLEGSIGIALRIKDQFTLRGRWNNFGPGDQDPPYRAGTSFTGGALIHPISFVGRDVKSVFQPYLAIDVGGGWLYGGPDPSFFQLDVLGGGNFDVGDHWTFFIEGGYLRIDYDDDGGQSAGRSGGVNQTILGFGIRYFL